jgi:hypothetical protein
VRILLAESQDRGHRAVFVPRAHPGVVVGLPLGEQLPRIC